MKNPSTQPDIAFLFYSMDCGGVERIIVNLSKYFVQHNLKVDLLLRRVQGEYLTHLPPEVRIIDLGDSYIDNITKLTHYLRQEQPLNLIARMYPHNELAIIARFFANSSTHIVVSIHSILSGQHEIVQFRWPILSKIHTPLKKLLARILYRWADTVLAVSHGAAQGISQVPV